MSSHPDVVVIGAGLIGCAIAHALARDGADVLVLEAGAIGSGASQASAGVLAPHIEGGQDTPLQALGLQSLAFYDGFIERARSDAARDIPYVRDGSFEVTDTEEGMAELAALAARLRAKGVASQLVQGKAVQDIEPLASPRQLAGLLVEEHGAVRVRDLVDALHEAATRLRARFLESTRVSDVTTARGRLVVTIPGLRIDTPRVVVTTGAWSVALPIDQRPAMPTHPVRGQLLCLTTTTALRRVLWGRDCYLVPWGGDVLAGATVEDVGFDQRATIGGVSLLSTAVQTLVPAFADATFRDVRVGLRPGSPDELPIIGPSQRIEGLVYASGHYRNGALLAPLTADLVARLVRDPGVSVPPACAPARFDL